MKNPSQNLKIITQTDELSCNSDLGAQLSFQIESKEFYNAMINASFITSDEQSMQYRYAKIKQLRTEIDEMSDQIQKYDDMVIILDQQVKYLGKKIRAVKIVLNMNKLMKKDL
ncbi:Hypothetical_protein [Hexamita inflata]|uniref:Hypothetical_protein n=1 Tax=Hexamita inflata TaxID=28002 RepID=A0AA86U019_9EUKA|nr:Hypothetical protein HINF_LOCUS13805 [Hexamita inflata]CAI9936565.1 Hypothetical protein HINF_LOCUS24210 [Hexamita inflata]